MLIICQEILDKIVAEAVKHYPEEACGLLVGQKGQDSVTRFVPVRNRYNEMHEKYPDTYPRTAKTAYLIDPMEQQRIFDEVQKNGEEVKSVFHSHTDHDAYFSAEDQLVACPWGEPMYPGVSYLVASIREGQLKEINEFIWDDNKREFVLRKRL